MRTNDQKHAKTEEMALETAWDMSSEGPFFHRSYHEMADRPLVERDALAQLENNVMMLEDLQGRLSFLMREVGGLLKA